MLTDPVLGRGAGPLVRIGPRPDPSVARDIDAVLVSHLHHDHLAPRSLRRVGAPVIAPRGVGPGFAGGGCGRCRELGVGESASVGSLRVTAVTATHDNRRLPSALRGSARLHGGDRRGVYFAGDTDLYGEMAALAGVDVALLPIWGWGTPWAPATWIPSAPPGRRALISPAWSCRSTGARWRSRS